MKHNPKPDWREGQEFISQEVAKRKLITVAYLFGVEHPGQSLTSALRQELFIEFRKAMDSEIQNCLKSFRTNQQGRNIPKELREQYELGFLASLEKQLSEFQSCVDFVPAYNQGQEMVATLMAIEVEDVRVGFLELISKSFTGFTDYLSGRKEQFSEAATYLFSRITWPLTKQTRSQVALSLDATVSRFLNFK